MKIAFVRHGEPDFGAVSEYQPKYAGARYDLLHLSRAGCEQVLASVEPLRGAGASLILSSPYTRTLQTASILSRALDLEIVVEPNLHDWMPVADSTVFVTAALIEEKIKEYQLSRQTGRLPPRRTWETAEELKARVSRALEKHRHLPSIVVSTHEFVIQTMTGESNVPYGFTSIVDWPLPAV